MRTVPILVIINVISFLINIELLQLRMEYIISKPHVSDKKSEMESGHWFNIWSNVNWPYHDLMEGDTLYFYDTKNRRLRWKTKVRKLIRYKYEDKNELWVNYGSFMDRKYFDVKPDKGYFLHYQIEVIEKLDVPKPVYNFSRLGWEKLNLENQKRWFNFSVSDNETTIDDLVELSNKPLQEVLIEVNKIMTDVSPQRINELVLTTLRNDSRIVKLLKQAANYKCQFPLCENQIRTKNNGYYIEVAHIKPVKHDGKSVLGNMVVLCPNHHKEFDYGDLIILHQSISQLSGVLNGKEFQIELITENQ